jgi:hypothetical protein
MAGTSATSVMLKLASANSKVDSVACATSERSSVARSIMARMVSSDARPTARIRAASLGDMSESSEARAPVLRSVTPRCRRCR